MAIRMHLVLSCVVLCVLALQNANAASIHPFLEKLMPRVTSFSWSDCGGAADPAHINSLTVSPDPVAIPGNLSISTSFTLGSTSATDLALALTMEKKVAGFFVKVPCVDNVGSCTYGDLCTDWAKACPKYFAQYGIPCTCPIPPNTYTINNAVIDINSQLPPGISGDYRLTGNLISASSGHIACLQILVTLTK